MFFLLMGFGIFFVINSPNEAAKLVRETGQNAGDWLGTAAESFSKFLKSLI